MKYSAFEQAALEASVGVREIDAEIERLQAKKELLLRLETFARQLLEARPARAVSFPTQEVNEVAAAPYQPQMAPYEPPAATFEPPPAPSEPQYEQQSYESSEPEAVSPAPVKEEWSSFLRKAASGSLGR